MKNIFTKLRSGHHSGTLIALKEGDNTTRLSAVVMGLKHLLNKQIAKGILFLGCEVGYLTFMITKGFRLISELVTLGDQVQGEVYNEAKGIYEYTTGDSSLTILLFGIAAIGVTVFFIRLWQANVKSAYMIQCKVAKNLHLNTFKEDILELFDNRLHVLLLFAPLTGILIFTILPLIFMISMAFTNYSKIDSKLILFDWVGLKNFIDILNFNSSLGQTFWSVAAWTIVWAVLATALNYILGMLLAIIINRKDTHGKSFWRFWFILSIAIPQFVSLLIMKTMLQPSGAVNTLLLGAGLIDSPLPFLTNPTWARATVIIINLWVGIPFTMIQVTGILQNIPHELYESAKVDGANSFVIFTKITLPYMLFVTTPYLITQFTGNINNFNVIYLLTGGAPTPVGSTAGKTDLLVTWLYKLTIDQQYYNLGAVIGILTFVILSIVSLITYRSSGSYKNEEGFM